MIEMIFNVTEIPPWNRHRQLFAAFDQLNVGDSLVLINDHDPRPLNYQLDSERGRSFDWTYLQEGPSEWKVRITKTTNAQAKASHCCGSCGG